MTDSTPPDLRTLLVEIVSGIPADVFYYSGPIFRNGYEQITRLCRMTEPRSNVVLILATFGGDPDAAYRIARALRHNYEKLFIFIPRECKSAGTLLTIGATELIIGDRGELGPLDVQISKPDEIFERNSGLDIIQALRGMPTEAFEVFTRYLWDIKLSSGFTLRASAEIATKLTIGLFSPILGQLDPIKLGEVQRAIAIAHAYGERLNRYDSNLTEGALGRLVAGYPSHGFVIDRKEARSLFKNVRASDTHEDILGDWLYSQYPTPADIPVIFNVKQQITGGNRDEPNNDGGIDSSDAERNSGGAPESETEVRRNPQRGDKKPKDIHASEG